MHLQDKQFIEHHLISASGHLVLELLTKMINERFAKSYCKDDISLIENYENAINDKTQVWHCHHRRETIFSRKDLIEIGEYYNRPACELIFLTKSEHNRLHNLGKPSGMKDKHHSAEARKKMSESKKGKNHPFFGKHHSEKARRKMSKAHIGKLWYNNGVVSVLTRECPEGFVKGRLPGLNVGRKLSEESRMKISRNNKGHIPWNKGKRMS